MSTDPSSSTEKSGPVTGVFPAAAVPFEVIADAIVEAVAYSDIFDFPLTAEEIYRYLPGINVSRTVVDRLLNDTELASRRLEQTGGCFTLPGRAAIVEKRRYRAQAAAKLWPKARHYGQVIARLPFARMVAVTGALAVDNSKDNDDLDYFIVTEHGRLWLCRAMVIALVRLAERRGDLLCPNYFLSERALVLDSRDLFTAHEVAQMVPVAGLAVYNRLRQLNPWVDEILPNATGAPRQIVEELPTRATIRSASEAILRSPPGDWLERWEMRRKIRKLRREHAADLASREVGFGPDWCKGHFRSYGSKTLGALAARLDAAGASR